MKTRGGLRTSILALPLVLLAGPTAFATPTAQNILGECGINFDDAGAINALPNDARDTFALAPYRQNCDNHVVVVEPLTHGHFHLSFEDPTIDCYGGIGPGGSWAAGRTNGSDCDPADWVNEPRFVNSHVQDHWISVWMANGSMETSNRLLESSAPGVDCGIWRVMPSIMAQPVEADFRAGVWDVTGCPR